MRLALSRLYLAAGWLSGLCFAAILILVIIQVVGRLVGAVIVPAPQIAGLLLAAGIFFGLAYSLAEGTQIRVTILVDKLHGRGRRVTEYLCLMVAAGTSAYFCFFSIRHAYYSWVFGDVTDGLVAIPYWIPQSSMGIGLLLLVIRFVEEFVRLVGGERAPVGDECEKERPRASDSGQSLDK